MVETKERITKLLAENRSIGDMVTDRCRSFVHILRVFQVEIWCGLKDWKRIPPIVEVTPIRLDSSPVDRFKCVARRLDDPIRKGWTLLNPSLTFWCVPPTRGEDPAAQIV